jgi:hypothetical protein
MDSGLLTEVNVGGLDLAARSLLGTVAVIALALDLVWGVWRWVVALVAFVGLYTSLTRHCTPYKLLGVSTAEKTCE